MFRKVPTGHIEQEVDAYPFAYVPISHGMQVDADVCPTKVEYLPRLHKEHSEVPGRGE
jgi:hypothetical protein